MISNRDIDRMYQKYNPSNIRAGDRVIVNVGPRYKARVVGLDLDLKNKKVHANLRLFDTTKKLPVRVDVRDCTLLRDTMPLYPGHNEIGGN